MDKRKINSLLKKHLKRIETGDLTEIGSYGTMVRSLELNLATKIQIDSLVRTLMNIRDLKKLLNFLTKTTGSAVFLMSRDHLFYSGTDGNSDLTTYNKLSLFRFSLKRIEIKKLQKYLKSSEIEEFSLSSQDSKIDSYQVEDSVLLCSRMSVGGLYFGFLGPIDSDISFLISFIEYLTESENFQERIDRIFR